MKAGAVLALAVVAPGAGAQNTYTLPYVLAADSAGLTSFVRIINRSERAGDVQIHAIDDGGRRFGPVSLSVGAEASVHFTSLDLERGNASKGLPSGVGDGEGNWRLALTTALDIRALAYIRTSDGFVTAMHDVAPVSGMSHLVPFFNPGSNDRQVSRLRIINPGTTTAEVTISGRDDAGDPMPGGTVRLTLAAGAAEMLTAQELEAGGERFEGSFGDGAGKWRFAVTSNVAIKVMSLLSSPTGHLANLSTANLSPRVECAFFGGNGETRQSAQLAAVTNCRDRGLSCSAPLARSGWWGSDCNSGDAGLYGAIATVAFGRGDTCRWYRASVLNQSTPEDAATLAINGCASGAEREGYNDLTANRCSVSVSFTRCGAVAIGR